MHKEFLTGNEALARGAYEAGVRYSGAYPGTPSTEILENIARNYPEIYAEWAPNEKVALEGAIGASYAGARSLAVMKHVGLNVAADPFFTNAYTGVNTGLVVITADEPGQHSSQNEQDNRHYARSAFVPMFEPSDSQECKDMIKAAYALSEEFDTPVLLRLTTRVCHSKSFVELEDPKQKEIHLPKPNPKKYVTAPAVGRELKIKVMQRTKKLSEYSNTCKENYAEMHDSRIGVIASGICYAYAKEIFAESVCYFKVGFSYPMPLEAIKKFAEGLETIYVLEENDPIMETELKAAGIDVVGKDLFPSNLELLPEVIRACITGKELPKDKPVLNRAPALCSGCPHRGLFYTLGQYKNVYISGDIGCYTLGFAPPFGAMHSVTCMGASISSAHGAQKVFDMAGENAPRSIAVIGDSTFFHTGINSLINVVYNQSKTITIILDNRITAMTGHQQNPGSGKTIREMQAPMIDIPTLVKAIGIKHVKTVNPNHLDELRAAIDEALQRDEASVIITRFPCILKKLSEQDKEEFPQMFAHTARVNHDKCVGCKACLRVGCSAISVTEKKAHIDKTSCAGCMVCAQVCPIGAIEKEAKE